MSKKTPDDPSKRAAAALREALKITPAVLHTRRENHQAKKEAQNKSRVQYSEHQDPTKLFEKFHNPKENGQLPAEEQQMFFSKQAGELKQHKSKTTTNDKPKPAKTPTPGPTRSGGGGGTGGANQK